MVPFSKPGSVQHHSHKLVRRVLTSQTCEGEANANNYDYDTHDQCEQPVIRKGNYCPLRIPVKSENALLSFAYTLQTNLNSCDNLQSEKARVWVNL